MDDDIEKAIIRVTKTLSQLDNIEFNEELEKHKDGVISELMKHTDCEPIIHNRVVYDHQVWKSVKDRLPKESGGYLVIYDYPEPIISLNNYTAHLIETGFSDNHDNKISHWKELPALPKELRHD